MKSLKSNYSISLGERRVVDPWKNTSKKTKKKKLENHSQNVVKIVIRKSSKNISK